MIILCKNEEKNIARCLESVKFADEVILVDSGSIDNTLSIAKAFKNVKIFSTEWMGFVDTKKFAVSKTAFDWILWLDADEVVTQDLMEEWKRFSVSNALNSKFKESNLVACISIPRKTFFLGHWVKHSGWYPDYVIRFFHKKHAHFNQKFLHEGIVVEAPYKIATFSSHLLHYSYHSLKQYFDKMNYYGILGAQELMRREKKIYRIQIFLNPIWAFIKFYLFKNGFRDGLIGLIICMGAAFSNFIKYSNYFFLKKYGYVENIIE